MGRVIQLLLRYGQRAVDWAWRNAGTVQRWLATKSPEEIAILIAQILGLG